MNRGLTVLMVTHDARDLREKNRRKECGCSLWKFQKGRWRWIRVLRCDVSEYGAYDGVGMRITDESYCHLQHLHIKRLTCNL